MSVDGLRRAGAGAGRAAGAVCAVAALLAAATGCGSGGSGGGSAITFHGTLRISGAVTVDESFTDDAAVHDGVSSCAAAASGGDNASQPHQWQVPSPPQGDDVTINVSPGADDYNGPGTYPDPLLIGGDGVIDVNGTAYELNAGVAQETLTVKPDGSGTLTFSNVPTATMSNAVPLNWTGGISGSVTWTCSN